MRHKTTGAALIVALFIVAIVATIATALMLRLQFAIYRTNEIINYDQMYLYAQAMLNWAKDDLANDLMNAKPNQLVDQLPIVMKPIKKGQMEISGTITDMQSCFNVNSLLQPPQQTQFLQLLQTVAPKQSLSQDHRILSAVLDWLQEPRGTTEFDRIYMKSHPPYRAAYQLMASISELRLVAGVNAALYQQLLPYVCALPDPGVNAINVNTAAAPVLMLLSPSMTLEQAQQIINARKTQPFIEASQFTNNPLVKKFNIDSSKVITHSSFFLAKATVKQGPQSLQLLTLLQRKQVGKEKIVVNVLWQTQGTL